MRRHRLPIQLYGMATENDVFFTMKYPSCFGNLPEVAPNGAQYRARGMRFMRFNDAGVIDLFWQAADNNIFVNPLDLLNPLATLKSVSPECIAQLPL
jgi:hypothetical protein